MLEPLVVGDQKRAEQHEENAGGAVGFGHQAVDKAHRNREHEKNNPRPPRRCHRNLSTHQRTLRAIQTVAIQVPNIVLDVCKGNCKCKTERLQNKRQPFDTACRCGQRRKQVVANHKRDHRNHNVHRPGHFNEG